MSTWSVNCVNAVNKQINLEYYASYVYHYLFSYFDRDSVGLKNIAKYFDKCSLEERDHAHKLMVYQNKRGGKVIFSNINSHILDDSDLGLLQSFEIALQLEQDVYDSLLSLHKIGESANDPQFTDFIESEYLEEQIDAMNELRVYISQLKLIGDSGHGQWHFNAEFND
jgi:ferritin heavy chain